MRTQIPGSQLLDLGVDTSDINDGAVTDPKLSSTGVLAGTYTKLTVTDKGRVTAGTNPTTLAEYGITDAVSVSGQKVLQVVTGSIPATSTTASNVPWDATAPLITEGTQIWTQAFTPVSDSSHILIMQTITVAISTTASRIMTSSIFAGNVNIGAAARHNSGLSNTPFNIALTIVHTPGSTAPITFSCRVGANGSGTTFVNQASATVSLGGAPVTEYIIMEVA